MKDLNEMYMSSHFHPRQINLKWRDDQGERESEEDLSLLRLVLLLNYLLAILPISS